MEIGLSLRLTDRKHLKQRCGYLLQLRAVLPAILITDRTHFQIVWREYANSGICF